MNTPDNICPVCGAVPSWATSRYCPRHAAELRAAFDRLRAAGRVPATACA